MAQSIAGVLDALYTSIAAIFAGSIGPDTAPVLVSFGDPGSYQPSAIVAIMDTTTQISRPTLGPNRSREMAAEVSVIISVYAEGDESTQQVSTDAAFALLTLLEQNLRTSPNERLGGASRDAWVSKADPIATVATDPESGAPTGRVTEIHVIVTTLIRY
jgi:hypothetical protein